KALFNVPFVGSLTLLLSAVLAFVMSLVLLGYTISTVARTQMQAMQLTFFFFLPSLLLSGFMFPYRGMPQWAQTLGEIFPLPAFLPDWARGHAKGRRFPGDRRGGRRPGDLHLCLCRTGPAQFPAAAGLTGTRGGFCEPSPRHSPAPG